MESNKTDMWTQFMWTRFDIYLQGNRQAWELKHKKMLPLFFLALSCITVKTPEKHADYVVLGKSINHRQSPDGELAFLNMVFFGEIFRTKNGIVTNGYLLGPGEASGNLRFSEGDVLFLAGKSQFSIEALTENFPDTTYYFNYNTPDGNIRDMPVTFTRDKGEEYRDE